jgi:hypothetical protein
MPRAVRAMRVIILMKEKKMEINSEFFQKYLEMISDSFGKEDMCVVQCKSTNMDSSEEENIYVLCALRLNAHSNDLDLIPVATLFSKNPYESMEPIGGDDAIVALQKPLEATAKAQKPWADSDHSVN